MRGSGERRSPLQSISAFPRAMFAGELIRIGPVRCRLPHSMASQFSSFDRLLAETLAQATAAPIPQAIETGRNCRRSACRSLCALQFQNCHRHPLGGAALPDVAGSPPNMDDQIHHIILSELAGRRGWPSALPRLPAMWPWQPRKLACPAALPPPPFLMGILDCGGKDCRADPTAC